MKRVAHWIALLLGITLALAGVCVVLGALIALVRGSSYPEAIAWTMVFGGALVALVVGLSGSPTRMAAESRVVVGGRFVEGSHIPQPASPFILVPAGLLVVGLGVLITIVAG